jgi:hypothetical protein
LAAPAIPQNLYVQTANQEVLVSWDLSPGATSYIVHRSLDNVTYTLLATVSGSPLATQYLDTAVTLETQYWYKVASSNGTASSFTTPQSATPVQTGEMSLGQIRLSSQEKADRVNSQFVTKPEWNKFINLAMYELYDLLITVYEDYYIADPAYIQLNGESSFALPNGSNTFKNAAGTDFIPRPYYKMMGVDLSISPGTQGWVTINKYNFIDRNKYLYPNTGSTIYGVYNLLYRVLGNRIHFIPTPSGAQNIRLHYIPRLRELLKDTDPSDISISGWIQYVIVRAAKYALDKEESDTGKLDQELLFLKKRIEETAINRDAGLPDKISNTRGNTLGSGWNGGWGGGSGGGY